MTPFEAVTHTFATLATGGFSTENASVGAFQSSRIHYIIIFFMFLAHFKDNEFRVYTLIILIVTGFLLIYLLIFTIANFLVSLMGYDLVTSFTSMAATLNNIGPGWN
jgi:trk system potassium uptake protein TrkH